MSCPGACCDVLRLVAACCGGAAYEVESKRMHVYGPRLLLRVFVYRELCFSQACVGQAAVRTRLHILPRRTTGSGLAPEDVPVPLSIVRNDGPVYPLAPPIHDTYALIRPFIAA